MISSVCCIEFPHPNSGHQETRHRERQIASLSVPSFCLATNDRMYTIRSRTTAVNLMCCEFRHRVQRLLNRERLSPIPEFGRCLLASRKGEPGHLLEGFSTGLSKLRNINLLVMKLSNPIEMIGEKSSCPRMNDEV